MYVIIPVVLFIVTFPFVGLAVTFKELNVKLPSSVSFEVTLMSTAVFSVVVTLSLVASGANKQSSVVKTSVAETVPEQPFAGTVYVTFTVLLPVPVKVIKFPESVAGPVNAKVPPEGVAVMSIVVPLQYKPPGLKVGVPEIETSTVVAPHM